MSISQTSNSAQAQALMLQLQTQVAESIAGDDTQVDGYQAPLDLDIVKQGGDAAVDEIRTKMYSGVDDPAVAQKLAEETLSAFDAAGGKMALAAPDGGVDGGSLGTTISKLGDAASNSPQDLEMLIELLLEFASKVKQADRSAAQSDLQLTTASHEASADALTAGAQKTFIGAMASGGLAVGGGIVSAGAGGYGVGKTVQGLSESAGMAPKVETVAEDGTKTLQAQPEALASQAKVFKRVTANTQHVTSLGQGGSGLGQGVGQMTQAEQDKEAAAKNADKIMDDNAADVHSAAHDSDKSAMDTQAQVQQSLLQAQQTQNQTDHEKWMAMARV